MKQKMKKGTRVWLAVILTLAMVLQTFAGFGMSAKAADANGTETGYTEMQFSDWSVSEGNLWGWNIYSLQGDEAVSSLDGVSISAKVNFNGDTAATFRIGGYKTDTADGRHTGFGLETQASSGRLILWPLGIVNGANGAAHVVMAADEWAEVIKDEFTLRMTFDEDATAGSWMVKIWINDKQTGSYNCVGSAPGVYLANKGVEFQSIYTEREWDDWNVFDATRHGFDVYKLNEAKTVDSLDGVAISGKVNFHGDTAKYFRMGGFKNTSSDARHAGLSLMTQTSSGRLILWPQAIGGTGAAHVVMAADEWAEIIKDEFILRVEFDKGVANDYWRITIYINNVKRGVYNCNTITPGTYIANQGATLKGLQEEVINYTEMQFEDWGVSEGSLYGAEIYSLTDTTKITSLDKVAVSGEVDFNGNKDAWFRIGGFKNDAGDSRHTGFRIGTVDGALGIWPQGIGGTDANQLILDATEWGTLIQSAFMLRMEFVKDEATLQWTVKVYINEDLKGSYNCGTVTPGLYIANVGVTLYEEYAEMTFGDWGISEGSLYGYDIYSLTDKSQIDSLDGVAITGKVNFAGDTDAHFRIGGFKTDESDSRHTGLTLRHQAGYERLILWPQAIGGTGAAHVVVAKEEWATMIQNEFTLRMEFDKDTTTAEWTIKVYINETLRGTYSCGTITPGLYIANQGVSIEGLGELTFEDLNVPDIYNPPTEMGGKTEVGKYITSVVTSGDTTVISAADTDNGYASETDYSAYGLDYVMDFDVERELKILQLTDTQIIDAAQSRAEDRLHSWEITNWASKEMYNNLFRYIIKTVREAQPDLILITGDVIYGEFDDNGTSLIALVNCMDSLKIPWAPIFGNHDNESNMGIAWQCKQFEDSPYCLFNRRNEIGGNGNYSIGLAKNGQLERVIYMMDNNGCANSSEFNGTQVKTTFGFTDAQKAWYQDTASNVNTVAGTTIPSFLAYHAPTIEMQEAVVAAGYQTAGSTETYTLGTDITNVQTGDSGTKGGTSVYTYEEPGLLEIMKAVGTDGAFFGHEHLNSISVAYEGIRWTYGLKTGTYDSTPAEVGGTLITLATDSDAFTVTQVKTATAEIDSAYPRFDYTLPEAPEKVNGYIYVDMTEDRTGYLIEVSGATIDDVAVYEGNYYNHVGVHLLRYTQDDVEVVQKLILYIKGDANLDGAISVKDLVRMMRQTKETEPVIPDAAGAKASDLDGNGTITEADTELMKNLLLTYVEPAEAIHYGLGEPIADLRVGEAPYSSAEFVAAAAGAYGVDTFRVWMPNIGIAKPDGNGGYIVSLDQAQLADLKSTVVRLQLNGIEQIVAMQYPLIPYDFPKYIGKDGMAYSQQDLQEGKNTSGEVRMDYYAFPEPGTEAYGVFMKVQEEYFRLLSEAVPGITHYEGINEPERGVTVHKIGWLEKSERNNLISPDLYPEQAYFEYSVAEIAQITVDYCHAITNGVRAAGTDAKVLTSGLTILSLAKEYLEEAYAYIKGNDNYYGDNNPDNYFEILNWHPYVYLRNTNNSELAEFTGASAWNKEIWSEKWVAFQKSMYDVAVQNGDGDTPVWFTEFGTSDYGSVDTSAGWSNGEITEEMTAIRLQDMFEVAKANLDFVDTIIAFRLFDKGDSATDANIAGEGNYGMIEEFDKVSSGEAALKQYGKAYYHIVKGEKATYNAINEVLNKYYNIYKGTYVYDTSEDFESVIVRDNTFISTHSDLTVTYSSGPDYLMIPEISVVQHNGSDMLAFDYQETVSTTLTPTGDVAAPVSHISFNLGKLEAGTYKLTFDVEGSSLDGEGYWGTTWLGVTTNSSPHNWTIGAVENAEHNEGGAGIALYRNGQNNNFTSNELTFTINEDKEHVAVVFQISGNVQGAVSKGAFRVLFDNILLMSVEE